MLTQAVNEMKLVAWAACGVTTVFSLPIFLILFIHTASAFTVIANVTDVLQTCDRWGLVVDGGTAPYEISFFHLTSEEIQQATTETLPVGCTRYTYINRVEPGSTLLAVVTDTDGQYATLAPLVRTSGSSDTNCAGLSDYVDNPDAQNNNLLSIGLGISLPIALVLILGGLFLIHRGRLRRRAHIAAAPEDANANPRSLEMTPVQPLPDETRDQNIQFIASPQATYHNGTTNQTVRNANIDPERGQGDQSNEETLRPPSPSSERRISRISYPPPELPSFTFDISPLRLSDNSFFSPPYWRQIQGSLHFPVPDVPMEPALTETDGVLTRLPSISLSTNQQQSP